MPTNNLTALNFTDASPALDILPAFSTIAYFLTAASIAVGSPTVSASRLNVRLLTAPNFIDASPVIDALPSFVVHQGIPALNSPSPRVVARPAFDIVPLSLTAVGDTVGSPTIGRPGMNVRVMTANNFVGNSPALDALPSFLVTLYSPVSLVDSAPVLTAPAIGQKQVLVPSSVTDARPVIASLPIHQIYHITGTSVIDSTPVMGAPAASVGFPAGSFVDSSPVIGVGAMTGGVGVTTVVLSSYVIDHGLNCLHTDCDAIYVCFTEPVSYATVLSEALGSKRFAPGTAFGAPAADAAGGRKITSAAIAGAVTASGTIARWAAVDSKNARLLADGGLANSIPVTAGETFTLSPITIHLHWTLS